MGAEQHLVLGVGGDDSISPGSRTRIIRAPRIVRLNIYKQEILAVKIEYLIRIMNTFVTSTPPGLALKVGDRELFIN